MKKYINLLIAVIVVINIQSCKKDEMILKNTRGYISNEQFDEYINIKDIQYPLTITEENILYQYAILYENEQILLDYIKKKLVKKRKNNENYLFISKLDTKVNMIYYSYISDTDVFYDNILTIDNNGNVLLFGTLLEDDDYLITKDYNEAKAWYKEKIAQGCEVTMSCNENGEYELYATGCPEE